MPLKKWWKKPISEGKYFHFKLIILILTKKHIILNQLKNMRSKIVFLKIFCLLVCGGGLLVFLPAPADEGCRQSFSKQNRWMPYAEAQAYIRSLKIRTQEEYREWSKSGDRPKDIPSNPKGVYKEEWKGWPRFFGTNWKSYLEVQAHVRSLGIKTKEEYEEWSKSGDRPKDIPSDPDRVYREEWESWPSFLGTKKEWMPYQEAKAYIQSLGIKSKREYKEWSKSGDRPEDIPSSPESVYKEEWEGWRIFLGTWNKQNRWRPYAKAQVHVQSLGIKSKRKYKEWSKSGDRPEDIPSSPESVYKEEWEGWGIFLGTGNKQNRWRPYAKAQVHVQSLGIKTEREYNEWSKSGDRPKDIPSDPDRVYREEWEGWRIFLGTGNKHKKKWRSYLKAKAHVQSLGIKSKREYKEWSTSGQRPEDIPSAPHEIYNEWEGWGIFLGTGNQRKKEWRSYQSAQDHVQSLGIKTEREYKEWSKSGDRPEDIPFRPDKTYKEWEGWPSFLGTKTEWRPYQEVKIYIQSQGIKTKKEYEKWNQSGKRPKDIPFNLRKIYREEWEGWGIFLGTGNQLKKKWRSYLKAKAYIQSLGIKTKHEYEQWSKSGDRPEDIPSSPYRVYSYYWKGWRSFLGQKQPIMPYKMARAYIRKKNMTAEEFYQWLKSDQRPKNFPRQPHIAYEDQWINVENFLGIQWMDFKSAQVYVQFLNVLSPEDYFSLSQSKEEGEGLPPDPSKAYQKDWRGWDHFLFGK